MDDIWSEYPPELLTEADAQRAQAEAELATATSYIIDPYNVSYFTLIRRWLERMAQR